MSSVVDAVLLFRAGAVHRDAGNRITRCGENINQAAEVSPVQAAAYRLPVCAKCFPTNHDSMRGVRTW